MFYQQICRLCHYILHQVAHIDCSAPSGKQHEPLTGVCVIGPLLPSSSDSLPNKMLATSTRVLVNFGLLMFLKKKWNEYKIQISEISSGNC